ncbi:PKD domain-containing protein [Archangium sp.]|uniref:PKD domain-containing protein n=1 Tax=Archangium sp. TaxID=1872627 RepID=UPI002D5E1448|nr:PKD domain-containing protein [Archangium sp.]HYO52488.1 PKD domain-containing protein [Archangium sp.]
MATALLLVLAVTQWLRRDGEEPPQAPHVTERRPPASEARPSGPPAPLPPPPAPRVPAPLATAGDALSAALHEERVSLASSVVVEGIDRDRPWVCAGEEMGLSARLGGVPEPGAVYRWVWLVAGGGAELHPGPTLQWRAPETAGRYRVRFQVCTDLGGRRVGVLAEHEVEIDVRRCGEQEMQRNEPLRIAVAQRGQGAFAFQALYQGHERIEAYAWDFGDGSTATTSEPRVEHTYALQDLGSQEVRSFTVRLQARLDRGGPLEAMAFALTRGQPPSDTPPPVDLRVSRWRPLPEGGWRSDVVVSAPDESSITWERLERISLHWDGQADTVMRPWREVLHVEEELGHGGFRGYVTVSASEASPDIKQLLDFLYGHDASGKEVVVSWSPFKRESPTAAPEVLESPPPRK